MQIYNALILGCKMIDKKLHGFGIQSLNQLKSYMLE